MTVDEFLVWAAGRPGRYELVDGEVFAMSPERARHGLVKYAAQTALNRAIEQAGLSCHMMPDGMTVRIDATTTFEPDALVYGGPPIDLDAVEVPDPVIVVEVLSPGTKSVDTGTKLIGYFRVTSLCHYLILDPVNRIVIHYRRGEGGLIETRIATEGRLDLSPPGLTLPVAELFADLPPPAEPAA
ncbi:Uma2 family endonuclease [Methylobacterium sp. J-070]|uniref:Uma2 family endonuclease n=1 Tax=Methylobacterium sp. J-070 TaxID=2836650 RepID=UPI001FB90A5B|nr:Uma2 family endonuclease [Methylobacterium sp. J-070]MCJ2049783.1 Uma2 family endonuclease [Methylobacterium sp. J-070]